MAPANFHQLEFVPARLCLDHKRLNGRNHEGAQIVLADLKGALRFGFLLSLALGGGAFLGVGLLFKLVEDFV